MESRKKVPNLSSNGVSTDYRRAFGSLANYLEKIEEDATPRTRHLARRAFLNRRIQRYDKVFSPLEYEDVVTPENQLIISEINSSVDKINQIREAMHGTKDTNYDRLSELRANLVSLLSDY